jgi:HD-GYP domain-containing protein (c-di-GMP phosphodiesterase class II)
MAVKQIPIDALLPGMYVVGLDRPWPRPKILADNRIECPEDVSRLKQYGIRYVTIDPTLGQPAENVTAETLLATATEAWKAGTRHLSKLAGLEADLERAQIARAEAETMVQSVFEGIKTGSPIDSQVVKETVSGLMDSILHDYDPLLCVLHMRQYDANLFAHAVNVCVFALVIGKSQGFDRQRLEILGLGALLHDVGMLRLPRNVFRKQGAYTLQERQLIRQHPRLGVTILAAARDIREDVRRIIVEHHERIDGSGYPAGLRGLQIFPLSEIVGIVDMYDALLSGRIGRPALPPVQAIRELYKYGLQGQCDRGWVGRTIRCLGIYPVGSLVELSTGERGVVVVVNPLDALRPTVKIVWDASGLVYAEPQTVDLCAAADPTKARTILRALDPVKEHRNIAPYIEENH